MDLQAPVTYLLNTYKEKKTMVINENFIRKLFLGFNCLFVLTGVAFIATGAGVMNQYEKYNVFLDARYSAQAILFIVCGFLTLVITILGYLGTFKRNSCIMLTICGMLCLLFIFGIIAGSIGIVLSSQSYWIFGDVLKQSMKSYLNGDHEIQKAWDGLQRDFQCCGSNDYNDWAELIENKFNETVLPYSCCMNHGEIGFDNCTYIKTTDIYDRYRNYRQRSEKIYYNGCRYDFGSYIGRSPYALAILAFTVAVLHLIGLIVALLVSREVKTQQNAMRTFK